MPVLGSDLLQVRYQDRDLSLYRLLAERLASHLDVSGKDLPEGGELNTVACRFLAKEGDRDMDRIYRGLKKVMPTAKEISIPVALRQMAEIRAFKLFVTTTFDPLLERALNEVRFGGRAKTAVLAYATDRQEDLPEPL